MNCEAYVHWRGTFAAVCTLAATGCRATRGTQRLECRVDLAVDQVLCRAIDGARLEPGVVCDARRASTAREVCLAEAKSDELRKIGV